MILFYLLSNLLLLLIYFLLSLSLINTATNSPKQWQYYYNNKNNQDCWNPARHSIIPQFSVKVLQHLKMQISLNFPLISTLHHIIYIIAI